MSAPSKLLVLVLAFALGACAASRPSRRARTPPSDTSVGPLTGQLAKREGSRSFESVAEAAPGASKDTYGTAINGTTDADYASAEVGGAAPAPEPTDSRAPQAPAPVAAQAHAAPPAPPEGGQPPARPPIATDVAPGQMLVYTATLTMAVYQVEQALATVERVAREVDGYLATRSDVAITIRVPRAKFDIALKAIEGSGDVLHREIKAEDVTDEFFDTEVRARNARAMRDRLAKLLQQAAVKEALEIEKELARVTQEIELLEGKLKLLRHRVAYSTITVAFRPRATAVSARAARLPFPWLEQLGLHNLLRLDESH